MNAEGLAPPIASPWGSPSLNTEEDLRAAQEYFFQTHATHAKQMHEGRSAQGFMKSYTRRKLEKEMGEDFKLYTGQELGEAARGEASAGIRGELNDLLRTVYEHIAHEEPIVSPIQEDATILRHPHGALEVCFGMVFFYGSLLKKYVTLASNRRKVLKSVLDEELFKWVWRMSTNYLLSSVETRVNFQESTLTAGLTYVPLDRQRASIPQKIFEIGQFALGRTLAESHLRFQICYYFVTYLRAMQSEVLAQPSLADPVAIYGEAVRRKPTDPIQHVLIAIDALMNMKGNSTQSFDDILKDERTEVELHIPPVEAQFLRQHDPYANPEAFGEAVKNAMPALQKAELVGDTGTLPMRLLLVLRAVTPAVRGAILEHVPAPVLVMLRNRIVNGPQDEAAKRLAERIKAALDTRTQRGEHLTVAAVNRAGMGGASAPSPGGAAGPGEAPAAAAAAPAPRAPAAPAAPGAAPLHDGVLAYRLLIGWRMENDRFKVYGITLRELFGLVGAEPRLVLPWVVLALQTGQAFSVPPAGVSKELVERLVKGVLAKAAGLPAPRLGAPQVAQLVNELRELPHQKALLTLILKGKLAELPRQGGQATGPLESLTAKFGPNIGDFLRSPSKEEFRELRMNLSAEERQVVAVLQKLARSSAPQANPPVN